MKKIFTPFFAVALCLSNPLSLFAQVNVQDSLALVDFYNSTNGPHWLHHGNWLTSKPLSKWYGVVVINNAVWDLFLPDNRLKGIIPSSLGNIVTLYTLYLRNNQLSGSIPSSLGDLPNLNDLELSSNQLSGTIPSSFVHLKKTLWYLYLDYNQLSGKIPSSLGGLKHLIYLDLSNNHLTGNIPSFDSLKNISGIHLNNNQLSGTIPSSWGGLSTYFFAVLDLSNNKLTGNIPSSLLNSSMHDIYLTHNHLSGNISSSIGNFKGYYLFLNQNHLSGSIPSSIGNAANLVELNLAYNDLSGEIPSSLSNLPILRFLYLNDNHFSGSIPSSIGQFQSLKFLRLNNNDLSDSIPSAIGTNAKLEELWLNSNRLSGSIPSSIGNLANLHNLNLSSNNLSGTIPSSFSNLILLNDWIFGYFNLSNNNFTFDAMEFIAQQFPNAIYGYQKNIPVHQNGKSLSVSAGGTLSNNTYKLLKWESGTTYTLVGTNHADSVFHPAVSGIYQVKILNSVATGLVLYSKIIDYTAPANAVIAAAPSELQQSNKPTLLVYPNPAKDILHIQSSGKATFSLIDESGKTLLTKTVDDKAEMNVSNLPAGLYYLKNNSTQEVQKIIISR